MAAAIAYPAELPGPSSAGLQAVERRMLTPAPFEARTVERDRRKLQHIDLPPFTDDDADIFRSWFDNELVLGGAWFAASWPFPAALVDQGYASVIRRWLAKEVSWKQDDAGFWHVSGDCEVRGVGMPPVQRPEILLGMHFDGDYTDVTGHPVTNHETQPGAPDATYPSAAPKFGSANYHGTTFANVLVSDDRGALELNRNGFWQVTFWCKPEASLLAWNGGGVVELHYGGPNGFTGDATTAQLKIITRRAGVDVTKAYLSVEYLNAIAIGGVSPGAWELQPIDDDQENAAIPMDGEWHFVAVGGDERSTRAYIDGVLAMDDHDTVSMSAPGDHPMMASPAFTHQFFVVGAAHAGFAIPVPVSNPTNWLTGVTGSTSYNVIFTKNWTGGLDDLCVSRGAFDYVGDTVAVPTSPF